MRDQKPFSNSLNGVLFYLFILFYFGLVSCSDELEHFPILLVSLSFPTYSIHGFPCLVGPQILSSELLLPCYPTVRTIFTCIPFIRTALIPTTSLYKLMVRWLPVPFLQTVKTCIRPLGFPLIPIPALGMEVKSLILCMIFPLLSLRISGSLLLIIIGQEVHTK